MERAGRGVGVWWVLALAMAATACGSTINGTTNYPSLLDPDQPRSPTSTITITSSGVNPVVLHRDHPVTATFVNNDTVSHRLEGAPDTIWDNCPEMNAFGNLKPGQQRDVVFSESDAVCAYQDAAQPGNVAFQGYVAIH